MATILYDDAYLARMKPERRKKFDENRARLVDLYESGLSRNAIARKTGLSPFDVTAFLAIQGHRFDGSQTFKATRASQAENNRLRAELETRALEDAIRLRSQMWEPCGHYSSSGVYLGEIPEPSPADKQRLQQASESAARVAKELAILNSDSSFETINLVVKTAVAMGLTTEVDGA